MGRTFAAHRIVARRLPGLLMVSGVSQMARQVLLGSRAICCTPANAQPERVLHAPQLDGNMTRR